MFNRGSRRTDCSPPQRKYVEDSYFNDAILKWKNLLEFDFVAEPKYRGGVWSATSDIWPISMVESLKLMKENSRWKR